MNYIGDMKYVFLTIGIGLLIAVGIVVFMIAGPNIDEYAAIHPVRTFALFMSLSLVFCVWALHENHARLRIWTWAKWIVRRVRG